MAFLDDFKKFAFRGNVIDLAVGVVIGGAFGRVVSAVVDDIVMPFVSLLMPSGDWRAAGFVLRKGATEGENTVLRFGDLFGHLLDFFIIAMVLFILLKRVVQAAERALHLNDAQGPSTTRPCPRCCETVPRLATRCRACCADIAADPA